MSRVIRRLYNADREFIPYMFEDDRNIVLEALHNLRRTSSKRIQAISKWIRRYRGPDHLSNCTVLVQICGYLSYKDILSCMSTNRRIRTTILNNPSKFQKEPLTVSIHKTLGSFHVRLKGVRNTEENIYIENGIIKSELDPGLVVQAGDDCLPVLIGAFRQLFGFHQIDIATLLQKLISELIELEMCSIHKLLRVNLFGISPKVTLQCLSDRTYRAYQGWLAGIREVRSLKINPIDILGNEDAQNEWNNLCNALESKFEIKSGTIFNLTRPSDGKTLSIQYTASNHYLDVQRIVR